MTRNRMLVILGAVAATAGLLGLRHERVVQLEGAPVLADVPTAVQVVAVRRGNLESVDHVLGVVYGDNDADIAPQVSGQVLQVLVREGARVARGAVLARLDSRELNDAMAECEADVDAARAAYEAQIAATARDSVLVANKAISQEQWEGSQALRAAATGRLEVGRRRLDQAKARLGYTVVRSPFAGVVSARMADPGDLAVPGKPLVRIVRQSAVRVRGSIPQELMTQVRPGTRVDLTLGDARVQATVSRVFPAMQGSHLGTFEIDIPDPAAAYVAGATVGVDLHLQGGAGLVVPLDALLEGASGGAHVFVVDQARNGTQTVRVVPLTVTTRSLDQAVVDGRLRVGDRVVVARPSRLMDLAAGMSVRPVHVTLER